MKNTLELIGGPQDGERLERETPDYQLEIRIVHNGRVHVYKNTLVMSVVRADGEHGGHAVYRHKMVEG